MQNNIDDMGGKETTPFISFEKAWAGLKPDLDAEAARREKRKRRVLFFWFTCIAVGLGVGIYIFESNTSVDNLAAKQSTLKKEIYSNYENKIKTGKADEFNNKTETIIASNDREAKTNNDIEKNNLSLKEEVHTASVDSQNKLASIHIKQNKASSNSKVITQHSVKSRYQSKTSNSTNTGIAKSSSFISLKTPQETNQKTEEEALADNVKNIEKIVPQVNTNSLDIVVNTVDSTKKTKDSAVAKTNVASTSINKETKSKISKSKTIHYGLQWNLPVQKGASFLDVNSVNQPAALLIPQFFVSKQIGKKHNFILAFNPYAQYYLNNKAMIDFSKYDVTIYSGSQSNSKPENITYTEATSFNKLISIEASILYQYQLSSKIKIGLGIANSWTNAALIQNKVIKNGISVTRDSLYGIDNTDKEFVYLKSSFLLGKFETQYQLNKISIGLGLSMPLSNPFNSNKFNIPLNTNLFLRYSW
jgi:hypothetical protein